MLTYLLSCHVLHDKRNIVRFRRVFSSRWCALFFYRLACFSRSASYIELSKRYIDKFGNICTELLYNHLKR